MSQLVGASRSELHEVSLDPSVFRGMGVSNKALSFKFYLPRVVAIPTTSESLSIQ